MARTTNKRQAGSSNDRKHGSFGLQAELEELARCEKQHPSKKRGLFGTLGFDELKRYEEQHPSKKTGLFGTLGFDELKRYEEQQPSQKRRKTSAPSDALEELVCPITLELPMDPVMAEDGTIYERSAIEEHLKNSNKSPTKNTRMGKKLFASHQVKSTIEKLVGQASRSNSLAKTYNDRIKEQKARDDLVERACSGDVQAMEELASNLSSGKKGFEKDKEEAYSWYKSAASRGSFRSMAKAGKYLLRRDKVLALSFLSGAAHQHGSDLACLTLAECIYYRNLGLSRDLVRADMLLRMGLGLSSESSCAFLHASEDDKESARALLKRIKKKRQRNA